MPLTFQAQHLVDVRDVATAHLAVLGDASSEGSRYICVGTSVSGKELCDMLTSLNLDVKVPSKVCLPESMPIIVM